MGNCIGLDFGTTYSVLSKLKNIKRDEKGQILDYELEACLPSEKAQSPCQDSIILKKRDGSLLAGVLARSQIGRKGTTVYKGFKMMLAEKKKEVLTARGYDETCTPKRMVEEYLNHLLQGYIRTNGLEQDVIDKIVIGVPEIWFSDVSTIDCRTALEEIVSAFPYINEVELVSEPVAASAFFVENYRKKTGAKFKGQILLVDYGGGTLDLTWCDVSENGTGSEISVLKRSGAGLNEEGYIGKAGMAFIENIVKLALEKTGYTDEELLANPDFHSCMNAVEDALMYQMDDIEEMFEFSEGIDKTRLPDEFYTIDFDGEEYIVTYGMLAKAYDNIIFPVLDEKLDEMMQYMEKHQIENYKIVPVGGFCNFYLTREQIETKFSRSGESDMRFKEMIDDRRDCEKAISYGAALIAENVIGFKQLSPYYLGVAGGSKNEIREIFYAIRKGDDIINDEPVFIQYEDGSDVYFGGDQIPLLVFNLDDSGDNKFAQWGEPLQEYKQKLALQKGMWCKIGFSLDRSMIITLHKHIIDPRKPEEIYEKSSVRLSDIYSILGNLIEIKR